MSTRSSARHHATPRRPDPRRTQPPVPAPAREPWDPHYAPPSQAQPPWTADRGVDRNPAPGDQYSDSTYSSSTRSGSPLLAGDTDPGLALPDDAPDTESTLLAADPPAPAPRRLGDPLPGDPLLGDPRRAGDPPPRAPGRGDDLPPRPPRRARYLVAVLLALALLGGGSYYLVRGSGPATPAPSGTAPARPAPASCGSAAGAAGSAASAALAGVMGSGVVTGSAGNAGPCVGQPFGYVTASPSTSQSPQPRASNHRPGHPAAGGPSSPPSSSSSSGSAPSSSASGPASSSSPSASSSASSSPSAASPAGTSSSSAAGQVLALINQARSSAGLAPLTITSGLDSSASAHNATMAGGCGLSHQCPGEPDPGARETAAGVHWTAAGENIGEGGPVADSSSAIAQMAVGLTQSMLNEQPPNDGHRLNILSTTFTHIGIAVVRDSSGTVWLTQDFSN
jgi:uncharacterized protein YkwD